MATATGIAIRTRYNGNTYVGDWYTPSAARSNIDVGRNNAYTPQRNYVAQIKFTLSAPATRVEIKFNCGGVNNTYVDGSSYKLAFKHSLLENDPNLINATRGTANDGTFYFKTTSSATTPSPLVLTGNFSIGTHYVYIWSDVSTSFGNYSRINSTTVQVVYTAVSSYTLSLTKSAKASVSITLTSSSYRSTGIALGNGSAVYNGEKIQITFFASSGYEATATYNGAAIASGVEKTVTTTPVIIVNAKAKGIAIIDGSVHLVYIYDGSQFNQYIPMIWTGSAWEIY